MLDNELYRIKSAVPESNTYRIRLLPISKIFQAHFPGHPVTPGVCIIEIASELLEKLIDRKVTLIEAVNVKFLSIIDPTATPEVDYSLKKIVTTPEGDVKVSVEVSAENIVYAKLSLKYQMQ